MTKQLTQYGITRMFQYKGEFIVGRGRTDVARSDRVNTGFSL